MRHSHNLLSSHHSSVSNVACPDSSVEDQNFVNNKCDGGSGTFSFKHCSWNNSGLSSHGGAIHLVYSSPQSSISLTIVDCSFLHCHETGDVGGGAISAKCIGTATVNNSLFYDCRCGMTPTWEDGAGILFYYIYTLPLIKYSSFVSCISSDDGGGCGIWYGNSSVNYAVDSCHFIKCKGTHATSSEGGAVIIFQNQMHIGLSNSLLHDNHAFYGGALDLCDSSLSDFNHPVIFSFFNRNSVPSNGFGNDVYLSGPLPKHPLLHCFSTPSLVRVYNGNDDWLPQGYAFVEHAYPHLRIYSHHSLTKK